MYKNLEFLPIALFIVCLLCIGYVFYQDIYIFLKNRRKKLPSGFKDAYQNLEKAISKFKSNDETSSEIPESKPDDNRNFAEDALNNLFKTFTVREYAENEEVKGMINKLLVELNDSKKKITKENAQNLE